MGSPGERIGCEFKSPKCKVLDQSDFRNTLRNYMLILFWPLLILKAANNVIVVCKKYYIETLVKDLGINTISNTSSTYSPCTESFDDILKSYANFIRSLN